MPGMIVQARWPRCEQYWQAYVKCVAGSDRTKVELTFPGGGGDTDGSTRSINTTEIVLDPSLTDEVKKSLIEEVLAASGPSSPAEPMHATQADPETTCEMCQAKDAEFITKSLPKCPSAVVCGKVCELKYLNSCKYWSQAQLDRQEHADAAEDGAMRAKRRRKVPVGGGGGIV